MKILKLQLGNNIKYRDVEVHPDLIKEWDKKNNSFTLTDGRKGTWDDTELSYIIEPLNTDLKIELSRRKLPYEKPLKLVSPEFTLLTGGKGLFNISKTGLLPSTESIGAKINNTLNLTNPSTFIKGMGSVGGYTTSLGTTGASLGGAVADATMASTMAGTGLNEFILNPNVETGTTAALGALPLTLAVKNMKFSNPLNWVSDKYKNHLKWKLLTYKQRDRKIALSWKGKLSRRVFGVNPDKLKKDFYPNYLLGDYYQTDKLLKYIDNNLASSLNHLKLANQAKEGIVLSDQLLQNHDKIHRIALINTVNDKRPIFNPYEYLPNLEEVNFSKIKQSDYNNLVEKYPRVFKNLDLKSLVSGNVDVPDFTSGKLMNFEIPSVSFDPHFKEGQGIVTDFNLQYSPSEYRDVLTRNMLYIQSKLPGFKPFGSTTTAAHGLPHATHDFDGYMTENDYNKWYNSLTDREKSFVHTKVPGETFTYSLDSGKYGEAGDIDINLIKIDPKTGQGNDRAYELYRQFYPELYEKSGLALAGKNNTDSRVMQILDVNGRPMNTQALMDKFNPVIKSIMDAIESPKSKHIQRLPYILATGKPLEVALAILNMGHMLLGNKAAFLPENINMGTLEDRIATLKLVGLSDLAAAALAEDPLVVRNYVNHWLITQPKLFRATNSGDYHGENNNLQNLYRNVLDYNPYPEGGDASGGGINTTIQGPSDFKRSYNANVLFNADFNRLMDTDNISKVIPNIKLYLNLNNNYIFPGGGNKDYPNKKAVLDFLDFLGKSFIIDNKEYYPRGFTGSRYGSGTYFGAGPLRIGTSYTITPSPEIKGGWHGYLPKLASFSTVKAINPTLRRTRKKYNPDIYRTGPSLREIPEFANKVYTPTIINNERVVGRSGDDVIFSLKSINNKQKNIQNENLWEAKRDLSNISRAILGAEYNYKLQQADNLRRLYIDDYRKMFDNLLPVIIPTAITGTVLGIPYSIYGTRHKYNMNNFRQMARDKNLKWSYNRKLQKPTVKGSENTHITPDSLNKLARDYHFINRYWQ